jgi:hypothetical protein
MDVQSLTPAAAGFLWVKYGNAARANHQNFGELFFFPVRDRQSVPHGNGLLPHYGTGREKAAAATRETQRSLADLNSQLATVRLLLPGLPVRGLVHLPRIS